MAAKLSVARAEVTWNCTEGCFLAYHSVSRSPNSLMVSAPVTRNSALPLLQKRSTRRGTLYCLRWLQRVPSPPPAGNSREVEKRAEGGGSHAGDSVEGAGEVALIGEANAEAEFGERHMGSEQAFICGADAQAMDMFADAFANAAAEDPG